jgi:cell division protein FtsZ
MVMPGLINLDFADVRSVMQEMGKAMMGTGEASGDNRAIEAASKAIANPLLDGVSMKGAKGVIVSITGGDDMRLLEVDEAANHIRELVDEDANIIWGSAFNPELEGKIRVSVVATGIEAEPRLALAAAPATSRAFSFSAPRKAEEPVAPVATAPEPVAEPVFVEAPIEPEIVAENDELILGSETQVSPPVQVFDDELDGVSAKPVAEPVPEPPSGRRRWLTPGTPADVTPEAAAPSSEPAPPAPRVKLGGTLFERMSSVSRGAAREDDPTDKDPLDIPRFLHRQNNQ